MPAIVEFFYGLGSRYSYLASTQMDSLQQETGCEVVWRPLSSVDLMALRPRSPFSGEPVSGQYDWDYRRRDAEMWADYYGVPYREPAPFVLDPSRFATACHIAGRFGVVEAYSRRMFVAIFANHDTVDRTHCERIAGELGLDTRRFSALLDDVSIASDLRATTVEAHDRGAFGVPTFFVGDFMIWGNDRLPLLRHHLLRHAPGGST